MKKIVALFLFITNNCFAQSYIARTPTQFDRFIINQNIEWATYKNDTIRFTNTNLGELLRNRFDKNEIKVSLQDDIKLYESNKIKYATKEQVNSDLQLTPSPGDAEAILKDNRFDNITRNLIELNQILYVENGRLKSYTTWVAPKKSIHLSNGSYLGYAQYFCTAFNYKYNLSKTATDKIIPLQQTTSTLKPDSISRQDILKEMYGMNLIETIWPYVLNGKLKAISLDSNKIVSSLQLKEAEASAVNIPVFDSTGLVSPKKIIERLSPASFSEIQITQTWYYNKTKNIVYSEIPYATIFGKQPNDTGNDAPLKPLLKIVFK